MANFVWKSFGDLLQDAVDNMTANSTQSINLGEGSVVRTLFESVAGLLDYFTVQLKKILLITRLATCTGADVDSFIADYGMSARLSATFADTQEILGRYAASATPVFIPIGTQIQSNDGIVTFQTIIDTNNANYDSVANGYWIKANQTTTTASIQSLTAGTIGNVNANTLTVLSSSIVGVDYVTNPANVINANNQETDAQVKTRFVNYVLTLSRATLAAIQYAVNVTQEGLLSVIKENVDVSGNTQLGNFVVVADDGSGSPPSTLLTSIRNNVELYRGFTIGYEVVGPTLQTVTATISIHTDPNYTQSQVITALSNSISNFMNALTFGQTMPVEMLAALAFDTPGILECKTPLLNGSYADVTPLYTTRIQAGTITINTY